MRWQSIGLGRSDFVHWSITGGLTGGLDAFFTDLRWDGWRLEVAGVALDQGLAVYPFLCTAESRPIGATTRRRVPWVELSQFLDELAQLPEGRSRFVLKPFADSDG